MLKGRTKSSSQPNPIYISFFSQPETSKHQPTNHLTTTNATMQFLNTILFATTSLAAALPQYNGLRTTVLPAEYSWCVENWHAGCDKAGCTYNFNVSSSQNNIYPGFKAYCSGTDTGYYSGCEILESASSSGNPSVAASLRPNTGDGIATMSVSLSFTDADTGITRNISGWHDASYNAFVAPLQNFTIVPTEVFAVL
ncbi:hypothetical protein AC579_7043 [Pseudocercospora musae]|uniref:Uncharacterized protein n=1 Tax=Pseudocercospora musae TaxID=113226 RepID=A0A139IAB8_9PEZI|nr:hypothetical protein AC579_7043 [Pseudocercospora musae]